MHRLEDLRAQPGHVRHRIAFFTAGGVSGVVAIAWLVAMSTSGSFSLKTDTVASQDVKQTVSETKSSFTELLGAAGAAFNSASSTSEGITVVDTRASSTLDTPDPAASATLIRF